MNSLRLGVFAVIFYRLAFETTSKDFYSFNILEFWTFDL